MKNIIFDLSVCQPIGSSKFHGGGVYGYIVFKKACELIPERLIAYYSKSRFIDNEIEHLIVSNQIKAINSDIVDLNTVIIQNSPGLVYSPLYIRDYNKLIDKGYEFIVTLHGLRSLEMNHDKYEYLYKDSSLFKCILKSTFLFKRLHNRYLESYRKLVESPNVELVTVSEHSRNSIKYYYPKAELSKIHVLYSPSTDDSNFDANINRGRTHYLIISANRWLKNAYRAIMAFDDLFEKGLIKKRDVIILGIDNNSKLLKNIKNRHLFIPKGYVNKDELEALYSNTYAFIYPSLNEGFGYPPLEAMKYGVPVIASPFASITEVCQDSVLYANPYSSAEIAMRIISLEDSEKYNYYSRKGEDQYRQVKKKQDQDLCNIINLLASK